MRTVKDLEARHKAILHATVRSYIETGEPISSRTVAKRLNHRLSAATIRNAMADLEDQGYLAQPHASAGRIPTGKAFQSYVQSLQVRRPLLSELDRLRHEFALAGSVEERVQKSSYLLQRMTGGLGIAAAFPTQEQTLDQVDLLALSDHRVLMVVVTQDQVVRNRIIHVGEPLSQEELNSIRNYLNWNFRGWSLPLVQQEVERRLSADSAAYGELLSKLRVLYDHGLLDVDFNPAVHIEGAPNLVDLQLTRERMRDILRALEEKKRILLLLDRFLQPAEGQVGIQVGLADDQLSLRELSLIGIAIRMPNGLAGKIAVLGPIRMDYERAISAVQQVGRALQSVS